MKIRNVSIIHKKVLSEKEKNALNSLISKMKEMPCRVKAIKRDSLMEGSLDDANLVIVFGGDGTFLKSSHYVKDQLIFGITSDKEKNVGFFMNAGPDNFASKIDKIFAGEYNVEKLTRISAKIGNKNVDELATNEFYFGHKVAYSVSRYDIILDGKSAFHKSSGVLISTPAGSSAWTLSAGGKKMPLNSKKMQYIVREPYSYEKRTKNNLKGVLETGQNIVLMSKCKKNILVADSLGREYPVKEGEKVIISISNKPLRRIVL